MIGGDGFSFVTLAARHRRGGPRHRHHHRREQQEYVRINSLGGVVDRRRRRGRRQLLHRPRHHRRHRIGDGTKIDNLVQIGHNVRIGRNCLLCGQVGIAGSTRDRRPGGPRRRGAGRRQPPIGDDAVITGGSGVASQRARRAVMMGYPAVRMDQIEIYKALRRLPRAAGPARRGAESGFQSGRERLDVPSASTDGGVMSDAVKESVRDKIVAILAEQAVLDPAEVREERRSPTSASTRLGLVERIFAIEEAFDIPVPFNANDPKDVRRSTSAPSTAMVRAVESLIAAQSAVRRVVITGPGSINALGRTADETLAAMREGRSRHRRPRLPGRGAAVDPDRRPDPRLRPEEHFSRQELTLYDPFMPVRPPRRPRGDGAVGPRHRRGARRARRRRPRHLRRRPPDPGRELPRSSTRRGRTAFTPSSCRG